MDLKSKQGFELVNNIDGEDVGQKFIFQMRSNSVAGTYDTILPFSKNKVKPNYFDRYNGADIQVEINSLDRISAEV